MTQSSAGGNTGTSTFPNTYVGWEALPLRSSAPTTHQVATSIDFYHIGTTGNELTGLSRFAAIPTNLSGVTVSLVKYYAKCFDPAPTAGSSLPLNVPLSLYQCLRVWDAGLATWNTYDGTNAWGAGGATNAGSDIGFKALAATSTVLGAAAAQSFGTGPQSGSFVMFTGATLAALVQDWMNGLKNNNGFVMRLAVDETGAGPRLRTPSGVSDSARDYMEITYTVLVAYSANELETGAPADTQDAFITYFLTVSEAGALIEASTGVTDAPVVRSEVLAGTDASAVALASLQALSEALTAIDADSSSVASLQALAEVLTAADADSASVASLQAVAEVLSAADTNASSVAAIQALAEALNAVDAVNSSVATLQALAEAVSATDANTVSVASLQAVAETMSAADANSSSAAILQALVEVLTAIDANSVSIAGLQALAEALNAIDARSASMSINALVIAEALNAIDTDSASVASLQALAEALNAVDTNSVSVANAPLMAEVLTAADANSASVASLQALAEALNAADADDSSVATLQALAEALNAIDASSGTPTNALTVAEQAGSPTFPNGAWNPADTQGTMAFSNANSVATKSTTNPTSTRHALARSAGKFYFEVQVLNGGGNAGVGLEMGVSSGALAAYWQNQTGAYVLYRGNGQGFQTGVTYLNSVAPGVDGDVIGIAVDFSAGTVNLSRNNASILLAGTFTPNLALFPTSWMEGGSIAPSVKILTSPSTLTYTPPAGYSAWEASVPGTVTDASSSTAQLAAGQLEAAGVPVSPSSGLIVCLSPSTAAAADRRGGTITTTSWSPSWFANGFAARSGVNYMEWIVTAGGPMFMCGLFPQSSFTAGAYPNNPNGEAFYGAQNNFGFQGPQGWAGGATGTSIANFGVGDVIGMLVDWSALTLTMTKNGAALWTCGLPSSSMDLYCTANNQYGAVPETFTTNLDPANWVYPHSGAVPFAGSYLPATLAVIDASTTAAQLAAAQLEAAGVPGGTGWSLTDGSSNLAAFPSDFAYANSNTKLSQVNSEHAVTVRAGVAPKTSGKWYFEIKAGALAPHSWMGGVQGITGTLANGATGNTKQLVFTGDGITYMNGVYNDNNGGFLAANGVLGVAIDVGVTVRILYNNVLYSFAYPFTETSLVPCAINDPYYGGPGLKEWTLNLGAASQTYAPPAGYLPWGESVSTMVDSNSSSVIATAVVAEAVSTLAEVNSSSFIATVVVVDGLASGIAAVDTSNYSTTPTAGIGEGAALQDNLTGSITSGVGVAEAASAIETDSANADNAALLIEAGNAVDTTNTVAATGLTSTQVEPSTLAALQDANLTLATAIRAEVLAAIESLFAQDLHERVVEEAMVLVDQQSVPAAVPGIAAVIDSLNAQDIATIVQLAAAQAVADVLAASESFAIAYEYNSSIVEALAAIETASSMLTVQVFAIRAEALNAVDASVNSSPGNPEDVRESVFVQESYTAQGNANVIASNPLSVTDLAAAMVAFTGSVLNGMNAVETVLGMLSPAVTTADALNAVDATNYGIVLVAIANELLNATETVTNTGSNVTKTLSDALAAADTTTPLTGSTPSVQDTLSLIDAFTRTGAAQFAGVIEVGNATMLAFTTANLPVAVADVLNAIEATNAAVGVFYGASGSEVLTALDTVDAANEWARGCFDRLSASDQQSITDISGYKPGAPVWTVEYRRRVWYRDLQVKRS